MKITRENFNDKITEKEFIKNIKLLKNCLDKNIKTKVDFGSFEKECFVLEMTKENSNMIEILKQEYFKLEFDNNVTDFHLFSFSMMSKKTNKFYIELTNSFIEDFDYITEIFKYYEIDRTKA